MKTEVVQSTCSECDHHAVAGVAQRPLWLTILLGLTTLALFVTLMESMDVVLTCAGVPIRAQGAHEGGSK